MTHPLAHFNPDCMVVEDLGPLAHHLRRLSHYCEARERAMRKRLAGDIDGALASERLCENLYSLLPHEWRW